MIDEAKRIEINQAIEYLREDACVSCIFNGFIGECTSVSDCYARKIADLIESLSAELEQVRCERDAAVEDLRTHGMLCALCLHEKKSVNTEPCKSCSHASTSNRHTNWQWRGVPKEGSHD